MSDKEKWDHCRNVWPKVCQEGLLLPLGCSKLYSNSISLSFMTGQSSYITLSPEEILSTTVETELGIKMK